MKMINEKPSKLSNIGQDVYGAHRHNFDTYDNPEKRAEKELAKKSKDNRKELKEKTIAVVNLCNSLDGAISALCRYEMALTLEKIIGYDGLSDGSKGAINELMVYVKSLRGVTGSDFNACADAFNRLSRKLSKIRWYVRSLEDAQKYLAPKQKNAFKECNGIQGAWSLNADVKFNSDCIQTLEGTTRAIQFGNSLTIKEREYCLYNLNESINLLNEHFNFNFKDLAFSFGARGKAGSIAHYQDSQKVLAFNRGWIGAFIHELGHAVDYSLGKISDFMPYDMRSQYRAKLRDNKVDNTQYYMKNTEIFARLFEVYLRDLIPEMTDFMQVTFDDAVMPELDTVSSEWMRNAVSGLVVSLKSEAV